MARVLMYRQYCIDYVLSIIEFIQSPDSDDISIDWQPGD